MKTVLFDLDDTLFDHRHSSRVALAALRQTNLSLQSKPLLEIEEGYHTLLEQLHKKVLLGEITGKEALHERFLRLFRLHGEKLSKSKVEEIALTYRETYKVARRPVRGALQLLERLKKEVKIGIVSNNILEEQLLKLHYLRMDRFVDELVVSEEVGAAKPDPKIFEIALRRLGGDPDRSVMVGDSYETDIRGAQAAGIKTVWLNRRCLANPDGDSVMEIGAFEPLEEVAEKILSTVS